MEEKNVCVKCNKEFEMFMFSNYNLGLCKECFEKEKDNIVRNESCDEVTHVVTCPVCNAKYGREIVDEKCKTKNCPVSFFWDDLDGVIIARWLQ